MFSAEVDLTPAPQAPQTAFPRTALTALVLRKVLALQKALTRCLGLVLQKVLIRCLVLTR